MHNLIVWGWGESWGFVRRTSRDSQCRANLLEKDPANKLSRRAKGGASGADRGGAGGGVERGWGTSPLEAEALFPAWIRALAVQRPVGV